MSQVALRQTSPAVRPAETPARRLHAVPAGAPARRPRLMFGVIALAGALAIGGAQMGLSILTTQDSYTIRALTNEQRQVEWQKHILEESVAGLSSPQFLAANAAALGLVAAGEPNYLRLSDAATFGAGQGAPGISTVEALSKAAVPNALVGGVPLVTDPEASMDAGMAIDEALLLNSPTPLPITDGLPTPSTH